MKTARDVAVQRSSPPYTFSCGSSTARNNAAYALRLIVEKMREARVGLSDETDIIKYLLGSSSGVVRSHGVDAAMETYKDGWRKDVANVGLITALKKEENDDTRVNISYVLGLASPQAILQGYHIDGSSEIFCPATRMLSDRNPNVRRNLLWGITEIFDAQRKRGRFYETFNEVPLLTQKNRVDAFDLCLRNIESLCSQSSPSKDDLRMLHNSCFIIFFSIDSDAVRDIKAAGFTSDYEKVEKRLIQIDPIRLIKLTVQPEVDGSNLNTWNLAYRPVEKIVLSRLQAQENPLLYLLKLKTEVVNLRSPISPTHVTNNLKDSLEKIDTIIVNYLTTTPFEKINWGQRQDFQFAINELLRILENSTNSQHQMAVLCLIESAYQCNIVFSNSKPISLQDALDSKTWLRLNKSIADIAHSSNLTKVSLTNPSVASLEGRSLILYRTISRSFKDYYGMQNLKDRSIVLALDSFQGQTNGLLLSGAAGSGKSLFGEVLANELALPLITLESNKLKEESGSIVFQDGATRLTIDQYLTSLLERIKRTGACVLLIDEVEKIASPDKQSESLTHFLQKLRLNKCKVLIVATTNYPTPESITGMPIDKRGESSLITEVLSKKVNSEVFRDIQPCYFFHERSVGSNFAGEYMPVLSRSGKIVESIDLPEIVRLSTGLSPASIIFSFSKIPTLNQQTIIAQLKKLKLENDYFIKHLSGTLRTRIEDLVIDETHRIEGSLNYFELALAAETIPLEKIEGLLKMPPNPLTQEVLIDLFANYK